MIKLPLGMHLCVFRYLLEISGRACNVICGLVFTLHVNWSCGDVFIIMTEQEMIGKWMALEVLRPT